ncbi:hypothetical protein [Capnocytophaga sputigena]|jgi:hypothetical protein|uniref:hypothetical protein n=1 Tax=Capnocytophaga sputigena TaxID=1019 RepID=UPI000F6B8745|nr:hypothetical protein [Capnocytophaga sputigena]VEI55251.1 Uncharacterised protein [Capnocytophaga sputigena]
MQTLTGDAYAKIPITIIGSDSSAEMLFLKENGITEQYLFITEPDSLTNDNRIVNADFYLLTPKGEFISAYRMTDGVISHQLVPKVKANYRLVVDTEVTPTGKKKPRKTPPLESIEDPNNKKEDSGGLDDYEGGGDGDDDPIQLDPVDVYGTIPAHYGSYPTYNGNNYENFTKEKDPKPSENGTGGGNGGSSSSDVGVGIVKGGKKSKNIRTIDDEEKEEKERKKQYKREDTIKDSLTNPCAKSLLAQAPNLNNDIAKILRETFGTNDRFNITVHNKSFATDPKHKKDVAYTETIGRVDSYNKDILICDIYLNDDIISKASQEYILGTIYHEVVHAFLNTESLSLGKESFNKKYPFVKEQYLSIGGEQVRRYVFLDSHERFAPFIDNLARGILSLPNTKVSMEEAIALAKAGVVENKSLSSTEIYLDGEFKSGRKGITCTP